MLPSPSSRPAAPARHLVRLIAVFVTVAALAVPGAALAFDELPPGYAPTDTDKAADSEEATSKDDNRSVDEQCEGDCSDIEDSNNSDRSKQPVGC